MREARDRSGRMPYRLWYDEAEIDTIMEDELRRAKNPRLARHGAIDVDSFIESHLGVVPQFVKLPKGVQGATDFFPDGTVEMRISDELSQRAADNEPGAEHMMRTTLAHESAHVLLHRILFLKQSEDLFGGQASRTELCRDIRPVGRGYTGEWWEWQANRGMGALLLPKSEMVSYVQNLRGQKVSDTTGDVIAVSDRYRVSRQVVRLRFEQLSMATDARQISWDFE